MQWDDVRNIHNYLGHHLPELRKNQVIASWAFKPYAEDRSKCDHASAQHIHGFIRIPEDVMVQTLTRSGHAGIFMQVKSHDKKHDSRFGVIALHGAKLEEALQQAASYKQALGVVQLGAKGPFAIRARREDLSSIRQHVHPQSITMQEGSFQKDSTWWVLKNVQVSTTCKDLSNALLTLGWQASVVRPAGKTSWIACSTEEPPATHLCLGSDYVAVIPFVKTMKKTTATENPTAVIPLPANFSMCPEDDPGAASSVTASTRFSDLKADLEERLQDMIDERMKQCDEKIAQVSTAVEGVRTELGVVVDHSRKEFQDLRDQQNNIQAQIQSNNAGMLQQMQSLFKQMQQELTATLTPTAADAQMESKRARAT